MIDSIYREQQGIDYICNKHDRMILDKMLKKINELLFTNIHFLAEIDSIELYGAGKIMAQYIFDFESESVRSYLIPQIVLDRVDNCDKLVIDLYKNFKISNEYISPPGKPSPANIYARYDTALSELKPKKLKTELSGIVNTPRDVFYLPLTTQMMASWKMDAIKDLLLFCASDNNITHADVGLRNDNKIYYPSYEYIKKQLKFISINGLKKYPSYEILDFIQTISDEEDPDLKSCIEKSIAYIRKKMP